MVEARWCVVRRLAGRMTLLLARILFLGRLLGRNPRRVPPWIASRARERFAMLTTLPAPPAEAAFEAFHLWFPACGPPLHSPPPSQQAPSPFLLGQPS